VSRIFPDFIEAFEAYTQFGEAPTKFYRWCAVSAIAGAIRRKCWLDQVYFKWYCNEYIILVAPPGIVSKSTTVEIAMSLLRRVEGVNFGPDVITWQALVKSFAAAGEKFSLPDGTELEMSPLTIASSEFGNLMAPGDREMVDLLVSLWDGREGAFRKETKGSGSDEVINPWINMIACTTPAWISGNFPEYMIGGGFMSRCIFVYAETKRNYVAYPGMAVAGVDIAKMEADLTQDLTEIAALSGEFGMTQEAVEWGTLWYKRHFETKGNGLLEDSRFGGYVARKQTHLHKLAMIFSISRSEDLVITASDMQRADEELTNLEADLPKVFDRVGKSQDSVHADRLLELVRAKGLVPFTEAYAAMHGAIPHIEEFEDLMRSLDRAGLIKIEMIGGKLMLRAIPLALL
jgi:Protein of unknown function (DUF3987)